MNRRSLLGGALVGLAALLLAACAPGHDLPTYRYRLTVEVETPQGLRTGSSVIQVRTIRIGTPAGGGVKFKVRGEAAAVDLPGGKTLFALLRSEREVEWAAWVMYLMTPQATQDNGDSRAATYSVMLERRGLIELPRNFPKKLWGEPRPAYPLLVTFGDLADPASVALVDPDDLAASFGQGTRLRRITVQLTDDPVTTGIEKRLGWLPDVHGALVDLPISEYPPSGTPLPLKNTLTEGDFKKGN